MTALHASVSPVRNRSLKDALANVPAQLAGLALAIASLGGAWSIFMPQLTQVFLGVTTPVAAALVLMVVLKYLLNPGHVLKDLQHTVVSSVMPTLAMAMMVVAFNTAQLSSSELYKTLAQSLWLTAVVLHIALFMGFIAHRVCDFRMDDMVPSWFVPPVGIIVACVTSPPMGYPQLTCVLFLLGAGAYAVKLPIMLYRLVFHSRITEAASPTFAIMAAPASLTLAGYLTISGINADMTVVMVLTPIAILMTLLVWLSFFKLMRLPFSPGYAAFTFPMVIGATALLKLDALLTARHIRYPQSLLSNLAQLELAVATVVVLYVALRYFKHYAWRQV